jgi:hypothetical protein
MECPIIIAIFQAVHDKFMAKLHEYVPIFHYICDITEIINPHGTATG